MTHRNEIKALEAEIHSLIDRLNSRTRQLAALQTHYNAVCDALRSLGGDPIQVIQGIQQVRDRRDQWEKGPDTLT